VGEGSPKSEETLRVLRCGEKRRAAEVSDRKSPPFAGRREGWAPFETQGKPSSTWNWARHTRGTPEHSQE